ncbi:DUF4476 domain-containing protein [Pedobacter sp. N36a]|uniref:DUF4476 domain-containing protein n=1 Tax=Pedobacter sp. N36a TaxID=2767996 RepID=UPI001656ED48|nr:DUF4476 domain-containing protein [Pedobacter sp. N36a]MBC8986239.1 DUF4476 domain-containing protein [Pedobacter sp. N36a]
MRKLLFLLVLLLQSDFIFAQHTRSTAELFIEIPERGNYVVYVDDEFAGSSKGRFRFYEIRNSAPTVVVMKDNAEVFRRRINLPMNARLLAGYSSRGGWRNISTLNLYDRGQYALDNWDRAIFSDRPGPGQIEDRPEVMTADEFKQLLSMINRESWADGQVKLVKIALKSSWITADQAYELLRLLKFGGDQLAFAKYIYPFIADKKNAMRMANLFRFPTDKSAFIDYIATQN